MSGPPRKPHGLRPEPSYRREPLGNPLSPTQTLARAREDQPIPFGRQPHRPPSIPTIAPSRRIARSSASFGLLRGAPARPGPGGFPQPGGWDPEARAGRWRAKRSDFSRACEKVGAAQGYRCDQTRNHWDPDPCFFNGLERPARGFPCARGRVGNASEMGHKSSRKGGRAGGSGARSSAPPADVSLTVGVVGSNLGLAVPVSRQARVQAASGCLPQAPLLSLAGPVLLPAQLPQPPAGLLGKHSSLGEGRDREPGVPERHIVDPRSV